MAKVGQLGAMAVRNGGTGTKLSTADNYRQWLRSKGGTGNSLRALEKSFFAANGGSGRYYTELMGTFCAAKGYTGATTQENWRKFLATGTA